MDKKTLIKIANRDSGRVGYEIPEMGINRQFMPRETKEITFEELERLSFIPGGDVLIKNYLVVRNEEALKALNIHVEPEYYYSEADIRRLFISETMDEFLDCLDFAPEGVLDVVKAMAVELPLNDVSKRDAILEKLNFNVTNAIKIKNTKFDGDSDAVDTKAAAPVRRAQQPEVNAAPARRATPVYNVVTKTE